MAMSMGPPMHPAFSLRVQLYAPNAYGSVDQPVRCFRVITTPESTVQKFCQEASRIHELSYGHPISIKRCQDDHGFDITQTEILGNLFRSMDTIRVIQASSVPSMRDSVPPTSALRFDPGSQNGPPGRKRDRPHTGPMTNGVILPPSASYQPNKRQRVSNFHPDHPLPSSEEAQDTQIVPNSQENVMLGSNSFNTSRPLAEKPPILPNDVRGSSFAGRGESRSRDINSSMERAVSATRNLASGKTNSHQGTPAMEDSIREQIASGDNGTAISNGNKVALKKNKTHTNGKLSTPPVTQHRSRQNSTPVELSSDPDSRKQRQRKTEEANAARAARLAAEKAERLKREADEVIRAAEQEVLERIEAEELQRAEAERIAHEKRLRVIEEQRLAREKERAENLAKKKAEAERQALEKEKAKILAKKKAEAERYALEREKAEILAKRKAEAVRRALEKERAESSARAEAEAERRALEKARERESAQRLPSSPPDDPTRRTVSPILPRTAPTARPQSSTPFIPRGRIVSVKTPSVNGSSPASEKVSGAGGGIEDNMPLPLSKSPRRVSFAEKNIVTPVRPLKSCLSKKRSTPYPDPTEINRNSITPDTSPSLIKRPAPSQRNSKSITPDTTAAKASPTQLAMSQPIGSSRMSRSPSIILPPVRKYGGMTLEQIFGSHTSPKASASIFPEANKRIAPLSTRRTPNSSVPSPLKDPRVSNSASEKKVPADPTEASESEEESDGSESESAYGSESEAEKSQETPVTSAPHKSATKTEEVQIETQSTNASTRDSRSPVVYSQYSGSRNRFENFSSSNPAHVPKQDEDNGFSSSEEETEMPDVPFTFAAIKEPRSGSRNQVDDVRGQVKLSRPAAPIASAKMDSPRLSEGTSQGHSSTLPRSIPATSNGHTTAIKSKTNGQTPSPLPIIGFGASLKGMNETKLKIRVPTFATIVKPKNTKATLASLLKGTEHDESDEETDASESYSESSSDGNHTKKLKPANARRTVANPKKSHGGNLDHNKAGGGLNSTGNEEALSIRKELRADVERVQSGCNPSPSIDTSPAFKRNMTFALD